MMFCCCGSKDSSSSYSVGKENKGQTAQSAAPDAHIETGKGPLSSSNQNLGPEASLDKGTIASARRERNPVTEQPIQSSNAGVINQSAPEAKKTEVPTENGQEDNPQVETPTIVKPDQITVTETKPVEKPVFVSTVNVTSNSNKGKEGVVEKSMPQLTSINSSLDKLEQAVTKVESQSVWAGKSAVPDLTSQLKAIHTQVLQATTGSGDKMADKNLQDVVSRLESVATRLESLAVGGGGGAGGADEVAASVEAYNKFLAGPVAEYFKYSNAIGGEVKAQSDLVKAAFDAQKEFLVIASKSKKPDQSTLMELLQSSGAKLQAVQEFREKNRGCDAFNHLSVISESIAALGWVTITPTPGPYVKDLADSGTFYLNRITKIVKVKDPQHSAWGKAWAAALKELQAYIKDYHTTGVTWNPKGGDAKAAKGARGAAPPPPPPPAGGAPPPPPAGGAPASSDGNRSALFASINQGDGVTKGLRKVTDDMKTHKNPGLRQGPAPFKPAPAAKPAPSAPKPAAPAAAKPPVTELQQGKKWVVEYHKNNKNIVLSDTEMRHTVYIYKCEGSVVQIKGKVNSIIVDSCKKTGIVFEDVLSSVEFVNCQSVQGQVTGKINTLSIDKTDGCMVYLSEASLNADIVTAKSSEMNILVPQGNDDYKEFALPEQYKTTYNKAKNTITTVASDSI